MPSITSRVSFLTVHLITRLKPQLITAITARMCSPPLPLNAPPPNQRVVCSGDNHGRITYRTPLLSHLLLLLLCMPWGNAHADGTAQITVRVLSLMYSTNWNINYINAMNAGFNASLAAQNWTAGYGVDVKVIRPPTYTVLPTKYLKTYLDENSEDTSLLVVLGPLGESDTVEAYETLEENDLVGFAPITASSRLLSYRPNLYFLRPERTAELIALIHYAQTHLRVLRLGFMYMDGVNNGNEHYQQAAGFMARMGYRFHGVFAVATGDGSEVDDDEFDAAWELFAEENPQAVIMMAVIKTVTKKFITSLVSDPRTSEAVLLAPALLQTSITDAWVDALEAANVSFVPHRVVQTGTNPLAVDTTYDAIKRFQVEMKNYLTSYGGWSGFNDTEHFKNDDTDGEFMVSGWIAGKVLSQALRSHGWLSDRNIFLESLYEQRRYLVDDLVIGDFGGECSDTAIEAGAVCSCNRGGKKVYMKELVEDLRLKPLVAGFRVSDPQQCLSDPSILQPPLSGLTVTLGDRRELARAAAEFSAGASAVASDGHAGDMNRLFLQDVVSSIENGYADLEDVKNKKVVTAVFGIVTEAMLDIEGPVFIDPITPTPHLNVFSEDVIHLSPTLEQQFYVLANYLANLRPGHVRSITRGSQSPGINAVLRKTLITFDINLSSVATLTYDDPIEAHLPQSGSVFVVGLVAADIVPIERHLCENTNLRIMVQFSDVALLYDEFVKAFNNSACAKRLVFTTSLPHWADPNTTSETVLEFHAAIKQRTPLSLLGFATGKLMERSLRRMEEVTPQLLSQTFFKETFISVADMRYGPYKHLDCIVGDLTVDNCLSNSGATNMAVWSMARVLDPMVPVLQEPMIPSMVYSNPDALSTGELVAIVGGTVFAFMALVGLCVFLYCTSGRARNNAYAPKDPMDPVTLIFTDIESSTAQWAAHPELMPDAVAAHHRMIRSLITRYGCYEVKTVGDSFMIACESAFAAVQLARDMQQMFLHHGWGVDTFDCSYREFEECNAGEVEGYVPPTARLDPDVYRQLWSGLRVRVGIHTGLCDIRHDEVTKGYDYYGQTPNMAARTESITNGGRVLLTRATYLSLSTMEREHLNVTPLGPVSLRGVPEPVEMYQLDAVPGRTFAPLRLDRMIDVIDVVGDGSTSASEHSSGTVGLSESAQVIASSLQSLLGTFTGAQRQKALLLFCERWRVTLPQPRGAQGVWDDECCRDVVHRIAGKVGHIVERGERSSSQRSGNTSLSSASVIFINNSLCDFEQ